MTDVVNAPAQARHSKLKMSLHWTLAAFVFFLFVSSWWMLALPLPSADYTYRVLPFQLHKNIGISLFLIVLVMIVLRIRSRLRNTVSGGMLQRLADIDQWLIYGLVAACCISGYMSSSYSGWDTEFWWLLNFPAWAEENDALNVVFSDFHQWSCWLLIAVVILHIAAALYHGLRNDEQLNKMIP